MQWTDFDGYSSRNLLLEWLQLTTQSLAGSVHLYFLMFQA